MSNQILKKKSKKKKKKKTNGNNKTTMESFYGEDSIVGEDYDLLRSKRSIESKDIVT